MTWRAKLVSRDALKVPSPVQPQGRSDIAKRVLDLAVGALLLVFATPLILFCVILIKLIDPGPAFFRQQRIGLNGASFEILKLRTMRLNSEALLLQHLEAFPEMDAEWRSHFKLRRDPRLVPIIGMFFRRSSIDELPQVINVLAGDMSIVGPRPLPDYHLQALPPNVRTLRQGVKPGVTGLWQISIRSDGDLEHLAQLDCQYIAHQSLWLDLKILWLTVGAVLSGRGAR